MTLDAGRYVAPARPYALLEYVLDTYKPRGTALEFGVGSGQSTGIIAAHMPVVGFDSFEGLPEDWRPGFPKGTFRASVPISRIAAIPNVRLVIGLYADVLSQFDFHQYDIGLVHIDCDLYSSTITVLDRVGRWLKPGAIVVFDEYHGYPGAQFHEQRAWLEWVDQAGVAWTPIAHGDEQLAVRIES
jgi:predicted O-methyltransferase YrrM